MEGALAVLWAGGTEACWVLLWFAMTAVPRCNIHLKHKVSFVHLFLLVCVCRGGGHVQGPEGTRWTRKSARFPARWNQTVSSLNDRWARRPSTYIMFRKAGREKERQWDRGVPTVRDFGLNNFMRGWAPWELRPTEEPASSSAPVGWHFFSSASPTAFSCWNTPLGQTHTRAPRHSLHFVPSV